MSAQSETLPLTQADLSVLTGNVQRPNGITWHDDNLYISCSGDWTLYELNSMTAQTTAYISGIRNAHTLHVETDDDEVLNFWVPDFQTDTLLHVTRRGIRPVANDIRSPWGITYFDEDSFFVSSLLNNELLHVTRSGEKTPVIQNLMSPTGIAIHDEMVFVANNGSARRAIEWYDIDELMDSKKTPTANPLISGLQNVTDIVMGEDGYLYFAYSVGTRGVVGRVEPGQCLEDGCTRDQVEIVISTELAAPLAGLSVSPDMRIFVHTMFSPDIYWAQLPVSAADEKAKSS